MRVVVRAQLHPPLPAGVEGCSKENFERIREAYADGVAFFVSKPGCPDCETMRTLLRTLVSPKKPVVEASLADDACNAVADILKAEKTPTVVYYKGGEAVKRVEPDGVKGWAEFAADLAEIAS